MEDKTIFEHINELKKGFLWVVIPTIVLFIVFYACSPFMIKNLLIYFKIPMDNVVALTPFENIQTRLGLSLGLSLLFLFPGILILFYRFCREIIPDKIKNKIRLFLISSIVLAFVGLVFGVFIFSKLTLNILMNSYTLVNPMWSIKSLVNFILISSLSFAMIMQIVWIIPTLNMFGILDIETLKKYRIFILLGIFVLSAFITPPDFFSQVLMAIPFYGSFELGIFLSKNKQIKHQEVVII